MPPGEVLYRGAVGRCVPSIGEKAAWCGASRHHVHLSKDLETARKVGSRRGKPVILAVDAGKMHGDGYTFFLSVNGVWLTDAVPPGYLSERLSHRESPWPRPGTMRCITSMGRPFGANAAKNPSSRVAPASP